MKYGDRVRKQVIQYLVRGVPAARKRFDRKTGRFLAPNGGWAVTHQDIILPLAYLYVTRLAGNPFHGDKKILGLAARGGDALCDWQNPDGSVVFIKPDGSRWGDIYMCWTMYHRLEAYILLAPHLDSKRRRRWERSIRQSYAGIAAQYRKNGFNIHNIPSWLAMGMIRAGKIFDEPVWVEEGLDYCRQVARSQHKDGYWPEGHGPTTIYNAVYVHSMGLAYKFTEDPVLLSAVKQGTDFHRHYTYPDGTSCETVDGRVRYHKHASPMGIVGFSLTPEGRGLVELLLERILKPGKGGLAPHLTTLLQHGVDGRVAAPPQKKRSFASLRNGNGLVRKKGPWFACLSGYLTPPDKLHDKLFIRWNMDRQQHISLWHEDLGLVVGGGNSKGQPERSTFVFCPGDSSYHHIADSARLAMDSRSGDSITLRYGRARGMLTVRLLSDRKVKLTFRISGVKDHNVIAGFLMPLSLKWRLSTSKGDKPFRVDPTSEWIRRWDERTLRDRWFETNGYRVWMPQGGCVRWPQYPFDPYAINNAAPKDQAAAHVYVRMNKQDPEKTFVIELGKAR